jgi:citrate lyase beta subunit
MSSSTESWSEAALAGWDDTLGADDEHYRRSYPGPPGPGPVHTVYVPAPRFDAETVGVWKRTALQSIKNHTTQWEGLLSSLVSEQDFGPIGIGDDRAQLASRTLAKLLAEPIEDLRIDFEDGFRAHRGTAEDDADEDKQARRAAVAVAELAVETRQLPTSWGVRVRSLAPDTRRRGLRTLRLFLDALLDENDQLPTGFVVTLPKVTSREQVAVFVEVLTTLEYDFGLMPGVLKFEIQVETPQTVLGADGRVAVAEMVHAAHGRVSGLHFGTYDYTASLGILGAHQNLRHPVADFAKSLMQLAAAETGVRVSDGSDNKVPVGSDETVGERWRAHAEGVQRALRSGIYQGWDLHPAQLPSRFAATFAFFRAGYADAAIRLGDYHRQSAGGGVLDEPATAFALARHLAAALHCGAVTPEEIAVTGSIGPAVVTRYLVRGAPPGVRVEEPPDEPDDHPLDNVSRIGPRGGRR